MNETETDTQKQYDLIYEIVSKKLEQQVHSLGSLDTKSSILLAVVGVVFAGYLQLLTAPSMNFDLFPLLVIIEVAMFCASGFFIFRAFILNTNEMWRDDPRPKLLLDAFSQNYEKGEYWLKNEIIKTMNEAYEHNDALIIKKYDNLLKARWTLYVGISFLIFHVTIALYIC